MKLEPPPPPKEGEKAKIDLSIEGKIELVNAGVRLIPKGEIAFNELENYPSLVSITKELGITKTQTLIALLITNFTKSFNVVRNMSEDQILECAVYIFEECNDFTIEDYVIMFTLAKRGKLGDILDHIDMRVIADIHKEYSRRRQIAFKVINEKRGIQKWREKIDALQKETPEQIENGLKAWNEIKDATQHMVVNKNSDYWRQRKIEDEKHQAFLKAQYEAKKADKNKSKNIRLPYKD